MKYTNKYNYPNYVQEWLKSDSYDYNPHTLSSTTLMSPPRMYALKTIFYDDLEVDINEMIAIRYGTAIHDSVEKVKLSNCIQEQRMRTVIDGMIVTGKFDILKDMDQKTHKLVDIKTTSVWTYIYSSKDEEYIKQLSTYKFLCKMNGYNVGDEAEIMMVFTDWSQSKAKEDETYPQSRIVIKQIKLMNDTETLEYLKARVKILKEALETGKQDIANLPLCTDEELWRTETTWAVMKKGRISAVKVFKTKEEADKMKAEYVDYYIEHRPGKVKRCNYCMARTVCTQYEQMKKEGLIDE